MDIDVAEVITAIGAIILGYFQYNEYTKRKMTDMKLEKMRIENQRQKLLDEDRDRQRNDNILIILGELWDLLYKFGASRVYILQPHPLGHEEMLSIGFEVRDRGVESIKDKVREMKISDVASFSSKLVKNNFIHIKDVEDEVEDACARSILLRFGCDSAMIRKLSDNRHDWIGSIFCEFNQDPEIDEREASELLDSAAIKIQYILPEYKIKL